MPTLLVHFSLPRPTMVSSAKSFSMASFTVFLFLFPLGLYAATFTINNECTYTVWPAILSGNGSSLLSTTGFALMPGDSNTLPETPAWFGRLWGRTLCSLDITGMFSCVTGDCGTSTVECAGGNPAPPITLVEFDFNGTSGLNLYDISLLGGFNLPVKVAASRGGDCLGTGCLTDLNAACPMELTVVWDGEAVACKSTCQTEPCSSSQFFKTACSGARVYTQDNHGFFPCSSSHYTVTFCPTSNSWIDGEKKIDPLFKKVLKYTGVGVISVICGFILFQIRLRLSNRGCELSMRAEIELQSSNWS